jgi:hypothetical protein
VVLLVVVSGWTALSAPLPNAAVPADGHAPRSASASAHRLVELPAPRTAHRTLTPGSFVIDPNQSYSSEPAPMGIADFGLTPSGSGYSYASPMIQASATIRTFSVTTGPAGTNMTFQLNVEDVIASGASTFVFWIQDVAFFDTHSHVIYWEDNVWNLSGGTGQMYSNSVAGNGTVFANPSYYADSAAGYPGSGVSLSEPTTIVARVVATNATGAPHVAFEYQDGSGWVTFDNVTFPFTTVGVNRGFLVDGFQYTPLGGYFDAEWTLSGPGGGLSQTTRTADLNLSLEAWNGHNLQAVRAAYNHGGNTAESMSNVIDTLAADNSSGALFAHATNGGGSLSGLYGPSNTGTLRISTGNVSSGTIGVNGGAVPFVGGLANLTLAPGSYALQLLVNGTPVGATNVTLAAGEFRSITLAPFADFAVEFDSVDLPPGTAWSVTVGGLGLSGNLPTLSTALRAGTYLYVVGGVGGYYLPSYSGSVVVSATSAPVTLIWQQTLYESQFVAENHPSGVAWAVAVDDQNVSGTGSALVVSLPNGTFGFTVSAGRAVTITPGSGDMTVASTGGLQDVFFAIAPGQLQGTVAPGTARLTVGGTPTNLSDGSYFVSLAAGNYSVVASLAGYRTFETNVSVAAGGSSTLNITLEPAASVPAPSGGSSGAIAWTSWLLLGVVAVGATVVLVAVLVRRPKPRT